MALHRDAAPQRLSTVVLDTPQPARTLRTLFGALIFVLGLQSVRFLFASLTWYLRDTVGVGVTDLIPIALAPFLFGFLIPVLARRLSVRGALWVGTWLLVLARTINQVSDSPVLDLWMSATAVAAFVGLLPLMLSMGRSAVVGGLILGFALDSAIRGMGLSLDLAYQPGLGPLLGVVAICVGALYVLWAAPPIERRGVSWRSGATLLGLAPVLFFQMLVLQNQGWTSEVAAIGGVQAQLRIALLNVVALIAVAWFERSRPITLLALVAFVVAGVVAEGDPFFFNLATLVAVPSAGLVWASLVPDLEDRGVGVSSVYLVGGMVLFVVLGLAYYVPIDLDLGFTQAQVRLVAAGLAGLFGVVALLVLPAPARPGVHHQAWAFAALAALMPLLGFLLAARNDGESVPDTPVRVMTYNIHSSYDTDGRFDIDAIASVIEDSGATVVGIQEIPRGRLISGVTDQVLLLQQRLGFEHAAFFGTTDPSWGNAVLSRYPITDVDKEYLPLVGTPMRRGYLGATLETPVGPVLFVSTHLQHINDRDVHDEDPEADLYPVHHAQIATILETWGGVEPGILVGDFNARPDWAQVQEILDVGWVDSWMEAGVGDGFTARSTAPMYRIDYVFHTSDLEAIDAGVLMTRASDHLPLVVDLAEATG